MFDIYGKDDCSYCVEAVNFLVDHNMNYTYHKIVPENRDNVIRTLESIIGEKPKTVPQIIHDGKYVGGYDDLVRKYS